MLGYPEDLIYPMRRISLALFFVLSGFITLQAQKPMLPVRTVHAPEFPAGLEWLNTAQPLSLKALRGKFVLLDFWTYCCINCLHIIPDLKRLEHEYSEELVVIGVHSAKFENEQDTRQIRQAILRYEIEHPVVNDRDFIIWQQYGARAWPSLYLIDPEGDLIARWSGEGFYPHIRRLLEKLIPKYEKAGKLDRTPLKLKIEREKVTGDQVLAFPGKVAVDPEGHRLFISDTNHHRVVIADVSGQILVTVGIGEAGLTDGTYAEARFHHPQGLWYDAAGQRLFVADTDNHALRVIDLEKQTVRTLAGTGHQAPWGIEQAGPGRPLNSPWDVLLHKQQLFVAMAGSHQIWIFDSDTGHGTVYAGSGRENLMDGPRLQAALAQPSGLATDGTYLYFADSETSSIRRVPFGGPDVRVETLIGEGLFEFGDVDGTRSRARLQHPLGLTCAEGVCYIADTYNHKIKVLDLRKREITSWLGNGKPGFRDGKGRKARLNEPGGLTVAGSLLYIADTNNHAIRVANRETGQVETLRLFEGLAAPRTPEEQATLSVRPGTLTLVVQPILPPGYKLNPLNPGYLTAEIETRTYRLVQRDGLFETRLPVEQETKLVLKGQILFCKDEATTCRIRQVYAQWPLQLHANAPSTIRLSMQTNE